MRERTFPQQVPPLGNKQTASAKEAYPSVIWGRNLSGLRHICLQRDLYCVEGQETVPKQEVSSQFIYWWIPPIFRKDASSQFELIFAVFMYCSSYCLEFDCIVLQSIYKPYGLRSLAFELTVFVIFTVSIFRDFSNHSPTSTVLDLLLRWSLEEKALKFLNFVNILTEFGREMFDCFTS